MADLIHIWNNDEVTRMLGACKIEFRSVLKCYNYRHFSYDKSFWKLSPFYPYNDHFVKYTTVPFLGWWTSLPLGVCKGHLCSKGTVSTVIVVLVLVCNQGGKLVLRNLFRFWLCSNAMLVEIHYVFYTQSNFTHLHVVKRNILLWKKNPFLPPII